MPWTAACKAPLPRISTGIYKGKISNRQQQPGKGAQQAGLQVLKQVTTAGQVQHRPQQMKARRLLTHQHGQLIPA